MKSRIERIRWIKKEYYGSSLIWLALMSAALRLRSFVVELYFGNLFWSGYLSDGNEMALALG